MKQLYKKIVIFIMASIIFFVGAGVTIVDFCCLNCVENVIFMNSHTISCDIQERIVEDHSCCSSDSYSSDVSSCTSKHEGKCCEAERISIDIDNRIYKPDLSNTLEFSFLQCFCNCFYNNGNKIESHLSNPIDRGSVPIPPRDYLSFIKVLII